MLNKTDLEVAFNRAVATAVQDSVGAITNPDGTGALPTVIDISAIQQDKLIPTLSAHTEKDFKQ